MNTTGSIALKVITVLLKLVALIPVSLVITFLLIPLWRWLEMEHGIESIGHSGPSEWCFMCVYLVLAFAAVVIYLSYRSYSSRG